MNNLSKIIGNTQLKEYAPDFNKKISDIVIDSTETAENAGMLKDMITFVIKQGMTAREIALRPIREQMDEINKSFEALAELADCKKILVNKIVDYQKKIQIEQRKKELEEAARIEPKETENINDIIAQANRIAKNNNVKVVAPVVNIKTRKISVVEITDINKIPKKYFDNPRIIEALKSILKPDLEAGKKVPGCVLSKKEVNY